MLKKSAVVAIVLIAILIAPMIFTGSAFATEKMITGEVVSVEPSTKTLVINAQGKEITFRVVEQAIRLISYLFTGFLEEREMTLSDMEKPARTLANLKPGDKVTVSYTEVDGKLTAQSVTKG